MAGDNRHLQLRLSREMRKEIGELSLSLGMTASDVIRGALFFGLPIFAQMAEIQKETGKRLIRKLKMESRLRSGS